MRASSVGPKFCSLLSSFQWLGRFNRQRMPQTFIFARASLHDFLMFSFPQYLLGCLEIFYLESNVVHHIKL